MSAAIPSEAASISIELNGQAQRLAGPTTVASLIAERRPRPPFAVEVNKRLVRRTEYAQSTLHDGDRVEIVTLVGGG